MSQCGVGPHEGGEDAGSNWMGGSSGDYRGRDRVHLDGGRDDGGAVARETAREDVECGDGWCISATSTEPVHLPAGRVDVRVPGASGGGRGAARWDVERQAALDLASIAFALGLSTGPGVYVLAVPDPTTGQQARPVSVPARLPISTEGWVGDGWIEGIATHYGESYNGSNLGCGTGTYSSSNPDIVAVSPARYGEWPCGTVFEVCGAGGCIRATRHDACPGCSANHLDLSEAGIQAACGIIATCEIRFRVVTE